MIGPIIPSPVPSDVIESLAEVEVQDRGRGPERLPAHLQHRQAVPAADSLPAHRRQPAALHARRPRRHRQRRGQRAHRRRHHQQPDLSRRQRLKLHAHHHRQRPHRAHGSVRLERFSLPACPPEARVAICWSPSTRSSASCRSIIPSIMIDVQLPIDQIPAQQGTDSNTSASSPTQVGYVFYIDPGPLPGMSKAYWGPQIKVGPVQPALSADMDAYTNVESLHFTFDQEKNRIPHRLHLQPGDGRQHPHSHSSHHAAQSAARADPAASHQSPSARSQALSRRRRQAADSAGHHAGPAAAAQTRRGRHLRRLARRHALRRHPQGATDSSACAAPAPPSTASITSRASPTKSSAASTSRASRSPATVWSPRYPR